MDELFSPCSSFPRPLPPSVSNTAHPVINFPYWDVPEQWLLEHIAEAKHEGYHDWENLWHHGSFSPCSEACKHPTPSPPPVLEHQPQPPITAADPAQRQQGKKRRGRKPGPRPKATTINHVELERRRREKLNRLFCELRAAVPTVSRMDKASLLADAASYIAELRARVTRLEAESRLVAATRWDPGRAASPRGRGGSLRRGRAGHQIDDAVEVRMVGLDAAAVRATSSGAHAAARLMDALQSLDLRVQHACVTRVDGVTVLDVVVDVPAALQEDSGLKGELLQMLHDRA